jgi:hypothetical protein
MRTPIPRSQTKAILSHSVTDTTFQEEEDCESSPIIDVCRQFVENPRTPVIELKTLFEYGDDLESISGDSIQLLLSQDFFSVFGDRVCEFQTTAEIYQILAVSNHFLLYPTSVCRALMRPRLVQFLRRHIFSRDLAIRLEALTCLENLAGDSAEMRLLLCHAGYVFEICSLVLSCDEPQCSQKASDLLCSLCDCSDAPLPVDLMCRVAVEWLNRSKLSHAATLLLSIAVKKPQHHVLMSDPGFMSDFLGFVAGSQGDEGFVVLALKFLAMRTEIAEEAQMYFECGILDILAKIIDGNPRKSRGIWWVIANVLKTVPESMDQFFALSLFDSVVFFIHEGEYEVKCAAVRVLVRVLYWRPGMDQQILELLMAMMELLDGASHLTVSLILDCALNIARLEAMQGSKHLLDALSEANYGGVLREFACGEWQDCSSDAMELCQLLDSADR